MLVFIDESGVHKKVDHSTFVLAYVESKNYDLLDKQICRLEKELNIDYFHWSETVWKVKEKFLDQVLKLDFKAKIFVVKNPVYPSKEIENAMIQMIVEKNIQAIYIDGKKPKWYERNIKKVLRSKGMTVKKLKTVKASQYSGIRLADMIAGLTRSYFDKKNMYRIEKFYKRLNKKSIFLKTKNPA